MRPTVLQTARRQLQSHSSDAIARVAVARCGRLVSPSTSCAGHAGATRLQQRTLFSLSDLASLSPFGNGGSGKGGQDFETYKESLVIPIEQAKLFDVVQDVERYDEFLPYCVQSRILRKDEKAKVGAEAGAAPTGEDTRSFQAELTIGYGQFRESYTSRVTLVGQNKVTAEAIPTPLFRVLRTSWDFHSPKTPAKTPQTRVDFTVEYAFNNPLYATVAHGVLNKVASQMMDAFQQRARDLAQKPVS